MNIGQRRSPLDSFIGRFDRSRDAESSLIQALAIGNAVALRTPPTPTSFISPEDVLPQDNEGRPFVTRLVVRSEDFSKITGIGGEHIRFIRELTGAHIIIGEFPSSPEEKIVVLGGSLRQVSDAFNATVQVNYSSTNRT